MTMNNADRGLSDIMTFGVQTQCQINNVPSICLMTQNANSCVFNVVDLYVRRKIMYESKVTMNVLARGLETKTR